MQARFGDDLDVDGGAQQLGQFIDGLPVRRVDHGDTHVLAAHTHRHGAQLAHLKLGQAPRHRHVDVLDGGFEVGELELRGEQPRDGFVGDEGEVLQHGAQAPAGLLLPRQCLLQLLVGEQTLANQQLA